MRRHRGALDQHGRCAADTALEGARGDVRGPVTVDAQPYAAGKVPGEPIVAPRVISSSSVSPGPPSGGWLAKSASAYSTNLPPSAAQPDAAEERVE